MVLKLPLDLASKRHGILRIARTGHLKMSLRKKGAESAHLEGNLRQLVKTPCLKQMNRYIKKHGFLPLWDKSPPKLTFLDMI